MSKSFTKLFSSITESTVWSEPLAVRVVWITMLAMADRYGRVWAAVPGLARRANVTLEDAQDALRRFLSGDEFSRTPDHDGRRIEEIDGGWRLLNYEKYREMQDEESQKERNAERQRRYRDRHRDDVPRGTVTGSNAGNAGVTNVTENNPIADADADAEKRGRPSACPHDAIIAAYHEVLPELPKVRQWSKARRGYLNARWSESAERQSVEWWREFFAYVRGCPFLMGKVQGNAGRDPFEADLEWLVTEGNFVKVIEGKYQPKGVRR